MKAVIYIEAINEIQYTYENSLMKWMKSCFPTHLYLDIDSKTDRSIINHIKKIVEDPAFEKLILIGTGKKNATLGSITFLLNSFIKQKGKLYILLTTEHTFMQETFSKINRENSFLEKDTQLQKKILTNWLS